MPMFLQQAQAFPIKAGFTQRITIAVMFGFSDAPPEWVIGHFHDRFSPVFLAADFDQAMFGVVGEALHASHGTALFDHSAKTVVTIALVLIGQQLVMHDQPDCLRAVQQVGRGVVGEGFLLALALSWLAMIRPVAS